MEHAPQTTHAVLGASAVRAQHSRLILNLLWKEREISRADLARSTGLSRSTVSAIVNDLLDTGLVKEARAGISSGGRRPIILEFQDRSSFIVGIELGATHVSCVLTDLICNVRASWAAPAPVRDDPVLALKKMTMGVSAVLDADGVQASQVLGIGVAVPSPVNNKRPGELLPLVVPKWDGYNVATHLEESFKRPVFVDNDANLGALAELWWGTGSSSKDLAYIKVATGIGAGLIIDGRIFRGSGGIAGEIGHTSIDPNGPPCVCGLNGCLSMFVGTPALLRRAKDELLARGSKRKPPTSIDELVNAALDGEPSCVEVLRYTGNTLGVGIANMLNLLNPGTVIIGGGIARAGDLILDPLQEAIRGLSLPASIRETEIKTTGLNEWGIAVGAATLALEAALETPSLFPAASRGVA
ncbi:MAG: ROK family transcriptional regulator [Myxococcales bacterium]|nr:ROK family transcriptional regulator [Myxococcales bacterium]